MAASAPRLSARQASGNCARRVRRGIGADRALMSLGQAGDGSGRRSGLFPYATGMLDDADPLAEKPLAGRRNARLLDAGSAARRASTRGSTPSIQQAPCARSHYPNDFDALDPRPRAA